MNNTLSHGRGALEREEPIGGEHRDAGDGIGGDYRLAKGGFQSCFVEPGQHVHLRISGGYVWATMEGDPTDHVLASGECLDVTLSGHLLIEALSDAHFSLEQNCVTLNPS